MHYGDELIQGIQIVPISSRGFSSDPLKQVRWFVEADLANQSGEYTGTKFLRNFSSRAEAVAWTKKAGLL
jgi:hypothetical protein